MKLQDCITPTDVVVYPFEFKRPEDFWLDLKEKDVIPESLFLFYCRAKYFSYSAAPRFLDTSSPSLFFFLKSLVGGIAVGLEEAEELRKEIEKSHPLEYSPIKKKQGQPYDPKAVQRSLQSFKYMIVTLTGLLDQLAEAVAILLFGKFPVSKEGKLLMHPGRASFHFLKAWTAKAMPPASGFVDAQTHYYEELHKALGKALAPANLDEAEWLELLYLYRNKLGHLGNRMFHSVGLHDKQGEFFTFFPNHWPRIMEECIDKPTSPSLPPDSMARHFQEDFVQQDLVEYSERLLQKVRGVIGAVFATLTDLYEQLQNFPPAQQAADALRDQSKKLAFRQFPP